VLLITAGIYNRWNGVLGLQCTQADIPIILFDVRFTPESGRSPRDQDVCFGPKADMAIPLAMATLEVRVRENSGAN
jgi:hypothetical protein